MNQISKLVVPLALLVCAVIVRPWMVDIYPDYEQLIDWFPYISLTAAVVLSIMLRLSRYLALSLIFFTAYVAIQTGLQTAIGNTQTLYIFSALSLALPVVIVYLFLTAEKGVLNRHGMIIVASVPVVTLIIYMVYIVLPDEIIRQLINNYIPVKSREGFVISFTAGILYLVSLIAGLYLFYRSNDEFIAVATIMLLYAFTTLAFFDQEKISTIIFGTAGLALIISLLRSSYNMAYRDELTGLLGRRALNDRLKGLGKKYVIAMTDVDHFKKFNDTYGHNIGDDVLKMVGKKIETIQGGGTAYRYGGEEFCILFPGKSLYECKPFLEVIRESVENYKMAVRNTRSRPKSMKTALQWRGRRRRPRNKNVSVTISIGAAERTRKHSSPDSVLKAADAALYDAKKNGRNCMILSEK